ncbi:glycoside hydrolase family 3 N-terminal domain-containing protein [Streptomyces sp. TS71-3]|uniref:glycoside hydrolase family 3 N-terminal domain-containing protein n=1 Tax=Streptomyces sp. TS71-3 TaxID=2733862 RepID=UPI001B12B7DC|nr:glycoside hydrolase family 3 N-terminal domain-containing protein [Streptomyces sp. TS71-3]GHJ41746.1 glycoside hydrolase family 3 [Streptomyces sp. TS71-3]
MSTARNPISRRGALIAGTAAAGIGIGIGGSAEAAAPAEHSRRRALTPLQQAGQRVIFSYPGLTPPQSLLDAISEGRAGGVIFFGENISSLSQIATVVDQLRQAHQASPVTAPLVLTTDQEGGQVRRLPGAPVLSEKEVGASANPEAAARDAGTGAGQNLAGVGMNVNLAPVLDVYRKAGDFADQFKRSYSTDPAVVGTLGKDFVTAQQATGVAATAKHFPGLGSASSSQNTDLRAVTLNVSLSQLHSTDERPYTSAIAAGVKLVMLSWAIYPALDSHLPAGLSPTVVQELRGRLGFTGVTVTDALEAGALSAFGTSAQRGVKAAGAGMDLLLCSARDVSQGEDTVTALAAAVQDGTLDRAAFDAAVQRVTALRNQLA